MSTFDTSLFNEIQYHLLEPTIDGGVTWASGLWTAAEVLDYANQRQYRFMKDTLLMMAYARIATTAGSTAVILPDDWIESYRADWKHSTTGVITELPRSSTWEIDHTARDWALSNAPRPLLFTDAESPTLQARAVPAASVNGEILLLYVSLTAVLTGAGEIFTVPDEFVPAIKYGVLADMLSKVGRAQDPARAEYCESRYEEGVEAARLVLEGRTGGW